MSRSFRFPAHAPLGSSSGDIPKLPAAAAGCYESALAVKYCKKWSAITGIRLESHVSPRQVWRGSSTTERRWYAFLATKILSSHCPFAHWRSRSGARAARSGRRQRMRSFASTAMASLSSQPRLSGRPAKSGWLHFEFPGWRKRSTLVEPVRPHWITVTLPAMTSSFSTTRSERLASEGSIQRS